ncbi:MAG: signal peptidase II [Cardiobacteriaceae bacterium]|nr:signal peptidase II [Cardiobacteriaceae bacterium]
MTRWLAVPTVIAWFLADYASKSWALSHLETQMIVVNDFFNLRLAFNKGAAFSFLAGGDGWQKYFFIAIAVGVCGYFAYCIVKENLSKTAIFAYASVIGGALGNVYDRLAYGHVVDFLDFHWGNAHYPTFNIADVGVCLGVGILLILSLLETVSKEVSHDSKNV